MLGVTQGGRLGVDGMVLAPDPGMLEDIETLRVGGHQGVFDAVVDHLDEVPGTVGATV